MGIPVGLGAMAEEGSKVNTVEVEDTTGQRLALSPSPTRDRQMTLYGFSTRFGVSGYNVPVNIMSHPPTLRVHGADMVI